MVGPEHKPPEASLNRNRLNGWKEVSNYLGKSVRTAQRWERTLETPIHRIHTPRGEIVFGFKHELDRWQSAREQERRGVRTVPDAVTLDWLLSLPEPEIRQLARSRRLSPAAWSELVCQACLTLHMNGTGAPEAACRRALELLSRLPASRYPAVTKQAHSVLARLKQRAAKS